MSQTASLVLLLSVSASALLLGGCANAADDGTGTTEGASTAAPAADAHALLAGNYGARMTGEWDGSLTIRSTAAEKLDFEFEISPDLDVAPDGRLGGTATLGGAGRYRYDDGSCSIDFERVTVGTGAQRGDIFVNAAAACGVMLGIDGHSTSSTALDFTATWRRL